MSEVGIKNVLSAPFEKTLHTRAVSRDPLSDFKKMLSESIEEVNKVSNEANQKVQEMVTGDTDIHEAMIAMEQAGISLKLMIQIRNKILSAYEEIMRMQF